ncbi:MAG: FAD-dependent oxidoreductase [Chloroflexi bacterium]|nr:FAD-dependent oxidoreductase [Chloroflexota bacterium]
MRETITENLAIPVIGNYDVIVCGGGIGGLAAAVSASRLGASVLLVEKSITLGGLATLGLISWYEPICDGRGKKVMFGVADELLHLAIQYGPNTLPDAWTGNPSLADTDKRFATYFSPTLFSLALDEWLTGSGVKLLLDTWVSVPVMATRHCKGVIVENKTGRGCYLAKVVIDATGDADILYRAGVPCICGKNYLTFIAYASTVETCESAVQSRNILQSRRWLTIGSDLWGNGHPKQMRLLTGVTAEDVTEYVMQGRKLLLERLKIDPPAQRDLSALPGMAQFRTTRRIVGAYELTDADEGSHLEDSIGVAVDFAHPGRWYELPYRILYNTDYDNLLTAGRSVSAAGWAWDVTRVIPVSATTGQAAGVAAALSARQNVVLGELDAKLIQDEMLQSGVKLHMS